MNVVNNVITAVKEKVQHIPTDTIKGTLDSMQGKITGKYHHPVYQQVDEKDADAIARAFVDTKPTQIDFPFKFPELKPHEIRARVLYTGICHSDVHHSKGEWGVPLVHPIVTGHEFIAIVTDLGSEVKGFKVGDRVGWGPRRFFCGKCQLCKTGYDNLCKEDVSPEEKYQYDHLYFGSFATHIQAPYQTCFHIPEKLPSEKAAPLLCAGATTYAPLVRWGKKGMKCAIIGMGGLGHLAVKFASKLGYHVTAFTSHPKEKEQDLKSMGAEQVASSTDLKELVSLREKFDLVMNTFYTNDSDLWNAYIVLTEKAGTYIQIAEPNQKKGNPTVNLMQLVLGQRNIVGSLIGSHKDTQDMLQFAADNGILPDCENFEWEDFEKAFAKCEKGEAHYRCVVNCDNYAKKKGLNH